MSLFKRDGRVDRLEDAMAATQATVAQSQQAMAQTQATVAALLARMAETDRQIAETNRINGERFARIEALLLEHNRILQELPEALSGIGLRVAG